MDKEKNPWYTRRRTLGTQGEEPLVRKEKNPWYARRRTLGTQGEEPLVRKEKNPWYARRRTLGTQGEEPLVRKEKNPWYTKRRTLGTHALRIKVWGSSFLCSTLTHEGIQEELTNIVVKLQLGKS
jgi:hypothetical protein